MYHRNIGTFIYLIIVGFFTMDYLAGWLLYSGLYDRFRYWLVLFIWRRRYGVHYRVYRRMDKLYHLRGGKL